MALVFGTLIIFGDLGARLSKWRSARSTLEIGPAWTGRRRARGARRPSLRMSGGHNNRINSNRTGGAVQTFASTLDEDGDDERR